MTKQNYASHSIESSARHATDKDAYLDEIEPLEERPRDMLAEAIGKVLEMLMNRNGYIDRGDPNHLVKHLETSLRNLVALVFVMKPGLLPGNLPGWRYAEALGFTRQGFSRLCTTWSDALGGMRGPGMRSQAGREAYRQMQPSGCAKGSRKARVVNHVGERIDLDMRARMDGVMADAAEYFRTGRPWTKLHRRELRLAGYIGDADELTQAGRERMQGQESAPNQGVVTC